MPLSLDSLKSRIGRQMGNCNSSSELSKRNHRIDVEIEKSKRENDNSIKLLLLGAAESGKSTVLKQMKIIHDNGYTSNELIQRRTAVYSTIIFCFDNLLKIVDALNHQFTRKDFTDLAEEIKAMANSKEAINSLTDVFLHTMQEMWNDKFVQYAYQRRDEFYLPDSMKYFMDALERINSKDFTPTEQDILHTRVSTMGVIEVNFTIKNKLWRVFDVGGQRSQRKKWIHCFDDAKAIIYVVALSEYDQVLMEDGATNRMQESLQLFHQVVNNKYFTETNVILFLNKKDLFEEKIMKDRSLRMAFSSYTGPDHNYKAAVEYIQNRFFLANNVPNKQIYCHHTCATDTSQVRFILDSVLDTILSSKLKGCGLY
ncbi:hypothetical protein L596_030764 [Steinernema carpocapsae]|uniref:Uncharacterized protein n=1 Tax=Steinernema carpocapsae TaxID=34508 RepID=A0A4U5LNR5_STECR|nr:hypothetical protein L596_030764 [Steinernema carpocapsae]